MVAVSFTLALMLYIGSSFFKKTHNRYRLIFILTAEAFFLLGTIINLFTTDNNPQYAIILMYVAIAIISILMVRGLIVLLRGGNSVELIDNKLIINNWFFKRTVDVDSINKVQFIVIWRNGFEVFNVNIKNNRSVLIENQGLSPAALEKLHEFVEENEENESSSL